MCFCTDTVSSSVGFRKILANRGYLSEITILSSDEDSPSTGPKCYRNCNKCGDEPDKIEKPASGNASMFVSCFFLEAAFKLHFNFPSPDWKTVRGRFFMVNGLNISCACAKAPNGFSPFCHIGDGCLDVVLIRHTSLLNILRLLLRVSSKTRTMVIL